MYKKVYVFFIFLLSNTHLLFNCPLCLSMPKDTEKPFFIDQNADYIDESTNFLTSKESNSSSTHETNQDNHK